MLTAGEIAEGALVVDVAQSLQDHLAGGGGGDPAEILGSVVPFADEIAVDIQLPRDHANDARFAVDVDTRFVLVTLGVAVGGE